ncbi:thiamine pyrophosphate-binding protein [Galactobacter sp.]|uniref:thiamine pyrophosphate-binding protein n=1 Tax=Galactobacter sp. TaxID=2676125 RepID=UPI0025B9D6D2|nr:thiamine pyrophosphate-binding protein [Galactobacter sp.]
MSALTVADVVGQALAKLGARHCFGVVGSGNFAVTNALRAAGVEFTATRHEGGAVTMADAYARMSDTVALVSVHQGCGLTNTATGLGEAAKSRTPLIVLAAEATAAAVGSNFAMDQPGLAHSVLAESLRVNSAASVLADVVRAFRVARDDRRSVVLNLPLDVQTQPVPDAVVASLATLTAPAAPVPPRAGDEAVGHMVSLLADAQRPVFIAGRGARHAGAELAALAETTGALLAAGAVANGLFEGNEFNLGISGGFSTPLAAELISGADLIVGFGCALNMWTMRHGSLIGADAKVVQVDLDPLALGAQRPIDLGVVGDAAATAAAVEAAFRAGKVPDGPRYRTPEIAARIAEQGRWTQVGTEDLSGPGPDGEVRIDPRVLSTALDEILPPERVVSIDSGNFMGYPSAYLRVPDEFGFCFTQAFQSIGLGLGTSIGAALAQPSRLPVLGTGDGGFLMAVAEMETAVRLGLDLLVVVYNDDAYGAEIHHFGPDDSGRLPDFGTVTFPRVDIAALARGFGAGGVTVRSVEDLDLVKAWLGERAAGHHVGPLVVDARIASDGGSWWLAEAFKGH